MNTQVTQREIDRALRLVENQRRASRAYYLRHRDEIKQKSTLYWENHKEVINERRRQRYALTHTPAQPEQPELR